MAKPKKSLKEIEATSRSIDDRIAEINSAYTTGAFKYLRLLVHIIGEAQFVYALYYWYFYVKIVDSSGSWGGKFKFLTFLDLILQAIYHSVALINDLFGSNALNAQPVPLVRKLRDYIFTAFAFPIAHNVCLSFWVVYAYDRELIFPRALDPYFPNWLNHVVHTNIAMLMIMDLFTCFRQYPSRKSGVKRIATIMFLYIGWLHIVYYHNGRWAYPLFNVLNFPMRYFMLFGMAVVSIACYIAGELICKVIWAPELKLLQQKSKLKQKE